ncbi:MAG: hypothetical protein R3B49_04910 [Phycisphaerales bacterium]
MPTVVGVGPLVPGGTCTVELQGSVAYLMGNPPSGQFVMYGVHDPATPVRLNTGFSISGLADLAVAGEIVYGVDADGDVVIFRTTDPDQFDPDRVLGGYEGGDLTQIAVVGERVYVAGIDRVLALDVADPAMPVELGWYGPGSEVLGFAVVGDVVYVGTAASGLQVVDFASPGAPVLLGEYAPSDVEGYSRVRIVGDRAYVTIGNSLGTLGGFDVVDVSDPGDPVFVARYETLALPSVVLGVSDGLVLAYTGFGGTAGSIEIIDVAGPGGPEAVHCFEVADGVNAAALSGTAAYVATNTGLTIVDLSAACRADLDGNYRLNLDDVGMFAGLLLDGVPGNGDMDGDGDEDLDDINTFAQLFRGGCR